MHLPFTHEQFLAVFADYNAALWPAVIFLWLLTVGALVYMYGRGAAAGRCFAAVLSLHWAWSGTVYHLIYFREINPAAIVFGSIFLIQAILTLWLGVFRRQLEFTASRSIWGRLGVALMVYAFFYPAIGMLFGMRYPHMPTFGVPCPTTILTAGALLLVPRRTARWLAIIPIFWAGIGGSAAFLLGVTGDYVLLLAGIALLVYILTPEAASRHVVPGSD